MFNLHQTIRRTCAILLLLTVSVGFAGRAAAQPEPSTTTPRWEVRFEVRHDLRLIRLQGEWYWFMTYVVTNRTGEDQIFVPEGVLVTDAGNIIRDGAVDFEIVQELLDLIGSPFLESKMQIIGTLKHGVENAREGLLIWPARDLGDVRDVRVFISGLSSDTQVVEDPVTGEPRTVRKSLLRHYACPGNPLFDPQQAVRFREQRWVMR
jgi:hypothetical protein